MNENNKKAQYPVQTYKIKRKDKTLGVDYFCCAPTSDDNVPPLELHSGYSRFKFTIVDKSGEQTVTPMANIPCRDIDCIKLKTDLAMQAYFLGGSTTAIGEERSSFGNSPAFTYTLADKKYRGKTPAAVLIENPQEKDNLLKSKQWLQENIGKYPGNKDQIAAIDDAVKLLEIGELQAAPTTAIPASAKTIYKTEYKHFTQTNEQGHSLVYYINITFDPSMKYPFICEISNCFAPIEKLPSGQHRPVMEKATHKTKSTLAMSDTEWVGLITHLYNIKQYFELTNFKSLLNEAQSLSYHPQNN